MRHRLTRSDNTRSRAPGWGWRRLRLGGGPSRVARRGPARTIFASGLGLWLCAVTACVLAMPGFVLGAEGSPPKTISEAGAAAPVDATPTTDLRAESAADHPEDIWQTADPSVVSVGRDSSVSTGAVLATLAWGNGQGQVGLAEPGEGLARGPEAVGVAPDGRIAILDSVNARLVLLDAEGNFAGSIPVPLNEPRFLAVSDDRVFVLDCDRDRQLIALAWNGEELTRSDLPLLEDVVTGLFATDRGPCVEVAHESTYLLQSDAAVGGGQKLRALPGRPLDPGLSRAAKAVFKPNSGLNISMTTMDKRTLKTTATQSSKPDIARSRALEHLVSIDGDGAGGLIVGARLVADGKRDGEQAALVLSRLAADAGPGASDPSTRPPSADAGLNTGDELLLADSDFTYLGQPYVVAPDGRVIQPVADETGYRLLVHTFASVEEVQP